MKATKMKQILKQLYSIPTWAITSLMIPILPKDHPWKKGFSLKEWEKGQTKLCKTFDFVFWIGILNFVVMIFLLR